MISHFWNAQESSADGDARSQRPLGTKVRMTSSYSLLELLKSDLERYYHYNGCPNRTPKTTEVWRNFLIPRCAPVGLYRVSRYLHIKGFRRLAKISTWINFYLHGTEISSACEIGPYFYMPHASGAVIGAISIGHHAVIYHQVTIGAKEIQYDNVGRPTIGNNVLIGSGAKILGEILIDDGCVIGANSVVTKSAKPGLLLVGIPAVVKGSTKS